MVSVDGWRARFEAALEKIEQYRNDDHDDMRMLTRWLMETEANPYGFLHRRDAHALDGAEAFAGLLHTIHHALVDDGEITFVTVSGRPMIVFAARDEIGNVELRGEVEKFADERRGREPTYEFLDSAAAFIDRQDKYESHQAARIALAELRRSKEITMEEWRSRKQELEKAYENRIHPQP